MKRTLLLLLLLGCGQSEPPEEERYDRIISLVPSVTEMLYEIGAADQLVGVTDYCVYPPEAAKKEKIGGITINYEKVLALQPDAAFTRSTMTSGTNDDLKRMGIRVVMIDAETLEEIARELKRLGRLTGHAEQGDRAAKDLWDRVRAVEKSVKGKSRATVYIETTSEPIGTAGTDSYTGDAIRRAGGKNIFDDFGHPWGQVSWESVLKADPDVILIVHDKPVSLESRPGWAELKAVRTGRVHKVPKSEFLYPTSRLVLGMERAAKLFHETD